MQILDLGQKQLRSAPSTAISVNLIEAPSPGHAYLLSARPSREECGWRGRATVAAHCAYAACPVQE